MMSELPDDAIGIYHRIFDFSGVQITFSSFFMALIKHYTAHFSHLGPLGLNKVITFEVLCRFLQIELAVTLFKVFQTLCKQGDWFSFAKRRAPSSRHPDAAIDDLRPAAGSFNMADVCCLSAHVIKLRDMPKGVLVLSGLSRVWKNRLCDPVLRVADGNVMGIHDFLCLPEWTVAEVQEEPYLDVRPTLQRLPFYCTPLLWPMSALVQSSGSTTRPSLFVGDDDESNDDACVEIPLVTPLRSATVIPSSENQSGSSVAPTSKGSNARDYQGKGVMDDDAAAPMLLSGNVSITGRKREDAPSTIDYFQSFDEEVLRICLFAKTIVGRTRHETPLYGRGWSELRVLSDDQLTRKMRFSIVLMLKSHVSALKKQVFGLNDELSSSNASFAKSKAKGKERKKKIKSLTKSLDNLHTEESTVTPASKSLELSTNVDLTASVVASKHNKKMVNAFEVAV
ncbi:hypothetical protein Tco_1287894, partial [Tanacetum coccineum]